MQYKQLPDTTQAGIVTVYKSDTAAEGKQV